MRAIAVPLGSYASRAHAATREPRQATDSKAAIETTRGMASAATRRPTPPMGWARPSTSARMVKSRARSTPPQAATSALPASAMETARVVEGPAGTCARANASESARPIATVNRSRMPRAISHSCVCHGCRSSAFSVSETSIATVAHASSSTGRRSARRAATRKITLRRATPARPTRLVPSRACAASRSLVVRLLASLCRCAPHVYDSERVRHLGRRRDTRSGGRLGRAIYSTLPNGLSTPGWKTDNSFLADGVRGTGGVSVEASHTGSNGAAANNNS